MSYQEWQLMWGSLTDKWLGGSKLIKWKCEDESRISLNIDFPFNRHEGYVPSSYLVEKSANNLETYE